MRRRSDLELEAAEQRENGLSAEEARYAARRAFGNTALLKEEVREMWTWTWAERLAQDIHYTSRLLRKSSGFAAVARLGEQLRYEHHCAAQRNSLASASTG